MKSTFLLRAASLILFIHLIGHCFGHLNWKKAKDPVQQEVIHQMTAHQFPFMGAVHSIGDYYEGYGWAAAIGLLFFALALWFLSSSGLHLPVEKKLLAALSSCLLAWCVVEFVFFFPFAGALTLVSALLSLGAFVKSPKSKWQQ